MNWPFFFLFGIVQISMTGPLSAAPTPAEAAKTAIRRLDLQTQLPANLQTRLPANSQTQLPGDAPADRTPKTLPRLDVDTMRLLLWLCIIVGVAILAYSLRDFIPMLDRSRRITAADNGLHSADTGEAMNQAGLVAEDLARTGRFVDAMHVLLLQSLAELRKRLDVAFADSLTSREILRRVRMSDVGRTSFAVIVKEVERTYFGGQIAQMDDYVVCRQQFELLKASLASAPST